MAHPYNETLSYPPSSYAYNPGYASRGTRSRRRSRSRDSYRSHSTDSSSPHHRGFNRNNANSNANKPVKANGMQKARVLIGLLQILAGVWSIWTIKESVRRVKEDRAAEEGARKREERRRREREDERRRERAYAYGEEEEEQRRRQRLEWERWQYQQAHGGSIAWDGGAEPQQQQRTADERGLLIDEKAYDWGSRTSAGSERDRASNAGSEADRRRRRRRSERERRDGNA